MKRRVLKFGRTETALALVLCAIPASNMGHAAHLLLRLVADTLTAHAAEAANLNETDASSHRLSLSDNPLVNMFKPEKGPALTSTLDPLTPRFAAALQDEGGLPSSENDWGEIGLIQNPSARTGLAGDFNFTFSNVYPYARGTISVTPTPWLEAAFRYTSILNRLYGPVAFSGNQRYKDRAFDVKIRLVKENDTWPDISVGFRDVAGTGLFSSQYLVGTRRFYDVDLTAGMGWGKMTSGSGLSNPLGFLSSHFKKSPSTIANATPGSFNPGTYFTGPYVALFGGIEYKTPIRNLRLKAEFDPNDYQNEAFGNILPDRLPINFDLEYQPARFVTLAAGFERGDRGMVRFTIHSNFDDPRNLIPIRDVPAPPLRVTRPAAQETGLGRPLASSPRVTDPLARKIFKDLPKYKLIGLRFAVSGHTAYLTFTNIAYRKSAMALGRAVRVLAQDLPPTIRYFDLTMVVENIPTSHFTLLRDDVENAATDNGSPEEIWTHTASSLKNAPAGPVAAVPAPELYTAKNHDLYPGFDWGIGPRLRQQVGGPDNFLLVQLYLALSGEALLRPGLTVDGVYGVNIYNDFNQLKLNSNSVLPHVRSDIKQYLQQGASGIFRLQADQIAEFAPHWYGRLSGGLLEEMFEGVDGEILYRPENSRWAVGLDVARVMQRGYDELFDKRPYSVTTGHLSLYYRLTPSTTATISYGKYLAGDRGATFTLSKIFDSGFVIGAFATKTNVSAAQFGEGSFDKGFFFSIPLDTITGSRSTSFASLLYRPLTRDGGQQLNINKPLYDITSQDTPGTVATSWGDFLK